MTTTTDNKRIIEQTLAELIKTGDTAVLEPLLRDDFVHHRPDSTTSTKSEWLTAVRALPISALHVDIHHVFADGDHVVMHSHRRLPDAGQGIAGVEIWRLEGGQIVEGWEIIEPVADAADHVMWWRTTEA
ncbi:nuclear transport factor 2 family protein [Streptomyces sp. NPDC057877]|uniref:nuclear transport factor 2 family protein n=1 Tax=Streptomyces sp. NPDC057877 TaxID=3346269 RepID=UPI0036CA00B9